MERKASKKERLRTGLLSTKLPWKKLSRRSFSLPEEQSLKTCTKCRIHTRRTGKRRISHRSIREHSLQCSEQLAGIAWIFSSLEKSTLHHVKLHTRARADQRAAGIGSVQGILTLFDVSGQTYASEAGAILRRRPSISGGTFSTKDPRKEHAYAHTHTRTHTGTGFSHACSLTERPRVMEKRSRTERRETREATKIWFRLSDRE